MLSSHTKLQVPPEILFCRIKIRQIFQWIFIPFVPLLMQYIATFTTIKLLNLNINNQDKIFSLLFGLEFIIFFTICILRKCQLAGINIDYLIGKVSPNHSWLLSIGITMSGLLFSIGSYRVSLYSLSNNFSAAFGPIIGVLMQVLGSLIGILCEILFISLLLHRFSIKWATKKAIIAICLLSLINFPNTIASFCYLLVLIFLYLSSRTLIVPAIAFSIRIIVAYLISFVRFFTNQELTTLAQLQGEIWFGIICLVISMPLLGYFFYKNWYLVNEPLPYYINCAKD